MAQDKQSPAFRAPTYSTAPDSQIETIGQRQELDFASRMSAQPKNIRNDFPVRHLPNNQ
jgi:hypothetical protein